MIASSFIALDVETAHNKFTGSICQIGFSRVENGQILETRSFLVDPKCAFTNSHIHGISATAVAGAPIFPEVLDMMRPILEGNLVVHHGHFDRKALASAAERYGIDLPESIYLDNTEFVRTKILKYAERGYSLKKLCTDYGIVQSYHHDAADDSLCLAKVFLSVLEETGLTIENLRSYRSIPGEAKGIRILKFAEKVREPRPKVTAYVKPEFYKKPDDIDGPLPFWGETILFTGEFSKPRAELQTMATKAGFEIRTNISRALAYLVTGEVAVSNLPYIKPSEKRQKAEELNTQGANIKIITEAQFYELVKPLVEPFDIKSTPQIKSAPEVILQQEESEAATRISAEKYQGTNPATPSTGWISAKPIKSTADIHSAKPAKNTNFFKSWRSLPKKARTWILIIAIIVLLYLCGLLTSCTPQIQEIIVTQIHTQQVEVTREIEVTRLVVVTATPPPPTPTFTFQKWSYQQAQQAIMNAGLEFENVREMTTDDYGLAPMNALEGYRFIIPSLCADCGGRLYIFDDPQKLSQMKEYYDGLAEVSAMFFSWVFVQDNVLVQISGDLPEAQALQYQQALANME